MNKAVTVIVALMLLGGIGWAASAVSVMPSGVRVERPQHEMQVDEPKTTEWNSEWLSYNDGTFENSFSWPERGHELAVRFFAPAHPLRVCAAVVWLTSSWGSDYASEVRIYADDGVPEGSPGTLIDWWVGDLSTYPWPGIYENLVYFDPPRGDVNCDAFFISYYQQSILPIYPLLGMDYNPTHVSTGNDWGKYNGVWGVFPSDGAMDFGIDVKVCYELPLIEATIEFVPPVLNLNSNGQSVKCFIELPEGFDVQDIDLTTVATTAIGDVLLTDPLYCEGGSSQGPDVMKVTFNRQELIVTLLGKGYESGQFVKLTVTGRLFNNTPFMGSDLIELVGPPAPPPGGGQGSAAFVVPKSLSVQQSSPNPFKLTTTLKYGLPSETHVRMEVYSLTGQRVATLVDGLEGAGYHSASWNGR